jgi:hypothetical protein
MSKTPYQNTKLWVVTEIMRDSHVANELQIVTANMLTATVRQQMVVI